VRQSSLLVIAGGASILLSGFSGSALAICDIKNYDRTAPPHIKGVIDDQYAHFEWASDAEMQQGGRLIWNYLSNLHDTDALVANWPRGQIQISTIRPLPPHGITCRQFQVECSTNFPVPNAPIFYSPSNQRQEASVFLSAPPALCTSSESTAQGPLAPTLSSNIASSYVDNQKKVVDLRFDTVASVQDNQTILKLTYQPRNLIIGLAMLPERVKPEQLFASLERLKAKGIKTDQGSIAQFTGINFKEQNVLSFDREWRGLNDQVFLFIWGEDGSIDLVFAALTRLLRTESAVILLDQERKPILMTRIPMYLSVQ
jgi:hypothetical protein